MTGMAGEKALIAFGNVPVVETARVVIVAGVFIGQNDRKRLSAIVADLPPATFESAAGGELGFGQFVSINHRQSSP